MENKQESLSSKKPVDSDFLQQRFPATSPMLTPPCVVILFISLGVLMISVGVAVLYASDLVVEYSSPPYNVQDAELNALPGAGVLRHNITINIDKEMKAPIYFYYELFNLYQNHRRYIPSRSNSQLKGDSNPDTSPCDPLVNFNGSLLYPCGLIANSFFNDTFQLYVQGQPLNVETDNIVWQSDKEKKFKKVQESTMGPEGQLPAVDNPDFINWMRAAALPHFRKLKYVIPVDLPKGTALLIDIQNTYRVSGFGGEKRLILSTVTVLGGKNDFLGAFSVLSGVVMILLAIFFICKHKYGERPLGQLKYFNWPSASKQFMAHLARH
jgi:hypothetical protein